MDWLFSTRSFRFRKLSIEDNILSVLQLTNLQKKNKRQNGKLIDEFGLRTFARTEAICFRVVSDVVLSRMFGYRPSLS
jgi:ABC-type lipopolysaccharide export system ATPase subunit